MSSRNISKDAEDKEDSGSRVLERSRVSADSSAVRRSLKSTAPPVENIEMRPTSRTQQDLEIHPAPLDDELDDYYWESNRCFVVLLISLNFPNCICSIYHLMRTSRMSLDDENIRYVCIAIDINLIVCGLLIYYLFYVMTRSIQAFTNCRYFMCMALAATCLLSNAGIYFLDYQYTVYIVGVSNIFFLILLTIVKPSLCRDPEHF